MRGVGGFAGEGKWCSFRAPEFDRRHSAQGLKPLAIEFSPLRGHLTPNDRCVKSGEGSPHSKALRAPAFGRKLRITLRAPTSGWEKKRAVQVLPLTSNEVMSSNVRRNGNVLEALRTDRKSKFAESVFVPSKISNSTAAFSSAKILAKRSSARKGLKAKPCNFARRSATVSGTVPP